MAANETISDESTAECEGKEVLPQVASGCIATIVIQLALALALACIIFWFTSGTMGPNSHKNAQLHIQKLTGLVESAYLMSEPNRLPSSLVELAGGDNPLVEDESTLVDPWGHRYVYDREGPQQFQIWSLGPDALPHTRDDVTVGEL